MHTNVSIHNYKRRKILSQYTYMYTNNICTYVCENRAHAVHEQNIHINICMHAHMRTYVLTTITTWRLYFLSATWQLQSVLTIIEPCTIYVYKYACIPKGIHLQVYTSMQTHIYIYIWTCGNMITYAFMPFPSLLQLGTKNSVIF